MDLFSKLRAMKVLLIDDDQWIRDSLSLSFECEGCHLQAFETAEEGMEALKGQAYDIIIADYRLPGMDGLEFVRRSQKTHPDAMRILITAYGSREVVAGPYRLGIQDVIKKPFTIESIEESLSRLIEEREQKNKNLMSSIQNKRKPFKKGGNYDEKCEMDFHYFSGLDLFGITSVQRSCCRAEANRTRLYDFFPNH